MRFGVSGCAAALLLACGCSHGLEWRNAEDYRSRALDTSHEGRLVALSCEAADADAEELCFAVARALSDRGGFRVRYPAAPGTAADVRVRLTVETTRRAKWSNAFVSFPGYLIFTPGWLGYGYTVTHTVDCAVTEAGGKPLGTVRVPVTLHLRHADPGRTWATSTIWPLAPLSPLNALYCLSYDKDVTAHLPEKVYPDLGAHIATKIIACANGTAPKAQPKPAPKAQAQAKPEPKPAPKAQAEPGPEPQAKPAPKKAEPQAKPAPQPESAEARRLKELLEFGLIDRQTYEAQLKALDK